MISSSIPLLHVDCEASETLSRPYQTRRRGRVSVVPLVSSRRAARHLIVGSRAIAVSGQLRQGSKQFALSALEGGSGKQREKKESKKRRWRKRRTRGLGIARCAVTGASSARAGARVARASALAIAHAGVMRAPRPRVDRRETLTVN